MIELEAAQIDALPSRTYYGSNRNRHDGGSARHSREFSNRSQSLCLLYFLIQSTQYLVRAMQPTKMLHNPDKWRFVALKLRRRIKMPSVK
jgi:hypothetical protein